MPFVARRARAERETDAVAGARVHRPHKARPTCDRRPPSPPGDHVDLRNINPAPTDTRRGVRGAADSAGVTQGIPPRSPLRQERDSDPLPRAGHSTSVAFPSGLSAVSAAPTPFLGRSGEETPVGGPRRRASASSGLSHAGVASAFAPTLRNAWYGSLPGLISVHEHAGALDPEQRRDEAADDDDDAEDTERRGSARGRDRSRRRCRCALPLGRASPVDRPPLRSAGG